jgi:hypothetical protein
MLCEFHGGATFVFGILVSGACAPTSPLRPQVRGRIGRRSEPQPRRVACGRVRDPVTRADPPHAARVSGPPAGEDGEAKVVKFTFYVYEGKLHHRLPGRHGSWRSRGVLRDVLRVICLHPGLHHAVGFRLVLACLRFPIHAGNSLEIPANLL